MNHYKFHHADFTTICLTSPCKFCPKSGLRKYYIYYTLKLFFLGFLENMVFRIVISWSKIKI